MARSSVCRRASSMPRWRGNAYAQRTQPYTHLATQVAAGYVFGSTITTARSAVSMSIGTGAGEDTGAHIGWGLRCRPG
jgi:hypothetical protein